MKNFKNTINFLSLDYKKEMSKIILISVILLILNVSSFLLINTLALSILILIISITLLYLYISKYSSLERQIIKDRENEFISIISYFKIFITNNFNVYSSFEALLPYCSFWMKEEVEKLLKNIDEDKSVQPFVDFGKKFQNTIIENVMISIYQMIDEGENIHNLSQFSLLFNEFAKNNEEEMFEKKTKSLDTVNTFPLIGAASITIILTFGIFTIIGDLLNGI